MKKNNSENGFSDTMHYCKKIRELDCDRVSRRTRQAERIEIKGIKKISLKTEKNLIQRLNKYLEERAKYDPGFSFVGAIFKRDRCDQNVIHTTFLKSENIEKVAFKIEKKMLENAETDCIFKKVVY